MARADVDVAETSLETARIAHARTARRFPGKDDGGLGDVLDDVVGVRLRLANGVCTVRIGRAAVDELDGQVVDGREGLGNSPVPRSRRDPQQRSLQAKALGNEVTLKLSEPLPRRVQQVYSGILLTCRILWD